MPPAIAIDNLTVRFSGRTVLDGFSLSVQPGEKVTLSGRSGSGKTTVLRCLLGFVIPDEGEVRIQGEKLSGSNVWKLRRRMAYVAQEPVLGNGRARDLIARPFSYKANAHLRDNLSLLPDLMSRFSLDEKLLKEDVATLSGGEKQRLAIISAILLDRRMFLLDEVTSALDRESRQAVADYFCSDEELTVLSVSHEAGQSCFTDQIVEFGRIVPGGAS